MGESQYVTIMPASEIHGLTVRVDVIPASALDEMACDITDCDMGPDLKFTFVGVERAIPHIRCLDHLTSARSILSDAGYRIDYSPQALDWIMHR